MSTRSFDDFRGELKRLLEDRPEQGWVFGVCATLARRSDWELWAVRAVAAILLLFVPFWAILGYFVLAMVFHETRPDAQRKLTRWARRADDLLEVLLRGLRNIVTDRRDRRPEGDSSQRTDHTGERRRAA